VLARTQRTYVRLYQDETNLVCTLLVDGSGSMQFGGHRSGRGSKLEYAQYLATALCHVITRGQDQAGLAVVADRLVDFIPPGGTAGHVARVNEAIERIAPRPATHMAEALRDLYARMRRRGVLLLISDFLLDDLDDTFAAIRFFRRRHWEVVVLHLVHPQEERLPAGTAYRFEGLENEGVVDCSPAEISTQYEQRFAAHCASVRTLALATGCDYRRVSTATSYLETLGGFLVERAG